MSKERIAWVAVGTNDDQLNATWFYAFKSSKKANTFVAEAQLTTDTISWEVYPCEFAPVSLQVEFFRGTYFKV